jgi:hypothetical protein
VVHKKVHITPYLLWAALHGPSDPAAESSPPPRFEPALLAAYGMRVDAHSYIAVGVAHQRLHSLYVLVVLGQQGRECVAEDIPVDVFATLDVFLSPQRRGIM